MKKFITASVLVLCIGLFQIAWAGGPNVKILAGYSIGTSQHLIESAQTYDSNFNITAVDDIYHSFGKGINIRGALGIPVCPNLEFNVESGISLSNGTSWEENFAGDIEKTEVSASHIPILATIIASTGGEGVTPYAGAGAGIYLYSITAKTTFGAQGVVERKERVKMPIGFHGLVGLEIPTGNSITFFGEIRFVSLGLLQSETEYTEAKDENGNDFLKMIDIDPFTNGNQQTVKYEKDNKDAFAPESFPASNIGILFGAKIHL
jgi:opacity protein-like surface antigen